MCQDISCNFGYTTIHIGVAPFHYDLIFQLERCSCNAETLQLQQKTDTAEISTIISAFCFSVMALTFML